MIKPAGAHIETPAAFVIVMCRNRSPSNEIGGGLYRDGYLVTDGRVHAVLAQWAAREVRGTTHKLVVTSDWYLGVRQGRLPQALSDIPANAWEAPLPTHHSKKETNNGRVDVQG